MIEPKFKTNRRCVVVSGKWFDSYSGKFIYSAKRIDIDHIIPLKKAHTLGANKWDKKKRKQFANDPDNLLPVSLRLNRQKGAKGPTKWMPPDKSYQCNYLIKWLTLTEKYSLKVAEESTAESSLRTKIKSCNEPNRLPASFDKPTKRNKNNTESPNQN